MTRLGHVIDEAGMPVAGAGVGIVDATVPMPEIALVTGPDGTFRVNLPFGTFTLRAHGPDGAVGEAVVSDGHVDMDIVITVRS